MDMLLSGTPALTAYGLPNATTQIKAGGKIAGNRGGMGDAADSVNNIPFGAMFDEAMQNVSLQDSIKNEDSYNLAIGDLDDLGVMMENSTRAQTAFQLLVQMRNKMLDSYQEIMRINL